MFTRGKYATVNYTASNGGRANGVAMKTDETKKKEQRRTKLQKKKKRKKKKEKKERNEVEKREGKDLFMLIESRVDRILISRRLRTRPIYVVEREFLRPSVCIFDRLAWLLANTQRQTRPEIDAPSSAATIVKYKHLLCISTTTGTSWKGCVLWRSSSECCMCNCVKFHVCARGSSVDFVTNRIDRTIGIRRKISWMLSSEMSIVPFIDRINEYV